MSEVLDALEDLVWRDVPQQALDLYEKCAEESQDEWEKAAYSPTLRRLSEILQFAPAPEGGTLPSSPSPLASMLASGLVGGGLGYGLGWLGEKFLPAKWKRNRMSRTGAILGALLGVTPGLMWGITNKMDKRKFNDPSLMDTPRDRIGEGFPPTPPPPPIGARIRGDLSRFSGRVPSLSSDADKEDIVTWLKHSADHVEKRSIDLDMFGGPPRRRLLRSNPVIPVHEFNNVINRDPRVRNRLDPAMRAAATGLITSSAHLPGKRSTRFVTPMDVGRMAAGMGSGYISGALVGKALGVMMGMPKDTQNKLKNTGMFAGIVANMVPIAFGT
jgi:hypothetical protein